MADLPRVVDQSKVEAPSTASLRSIGHERCHIGMSMISVDVNLIDARYYRVLLGRGQPGVRFGPHFVVVVNVISLGGTASEGAQGSQVAVMLQPRRSHESWYEHRPPQHSVSERRSEPLRIVGRRVLRRRGGRRRRSRFVGRLSQLDCGGIPLVGFFAIPGRAADRSTATPGQSLVQHAR